MRIVLSKMSFQYADQPWLFENVSATVSPGDRVAVIGPNGAGKSTLLKLILGSVESSAGHIRRDFEPVRCVMDPAANGQSWGQAMWTELTRALLSDPALLLLDEPTRHLDLSHRRQLAEWLRRKPGLAVICVSHDLDFLDAVATHTWHVAPGEFRTVDATPSAYLRQCEQERAAYQRRYGQQQQQIVRLEADIRETKEHARSVERGTIDSGQRRYAKKVAKKALSREKRLEHWQRSGEVLEAPRDAHLLRHTWNHVRCGTGPVLRVEGGSLGYASPILENVFLEAQAGERIALVGDNGTGKSSLLEAVLGRFPGWQAGRWRMVESPGYVRQVFGAGDTGACWEYFRKRSALADGFGRAWLQSYGFQERHLTQSVQSLSHGEQVKLQIAALAAAGWPVLALDEPEHHLDWPSLESVSQGLAGYPGTLLVISHQPRFLAQLGMTTVWRIMGRAVESEPWGEQSL